MHNQCEVFDAFFPNSNKKIVDEIEFFVCVKVLFICAFNSMNSTITANYNKFAAPLKCMVHLSIACVCVCACVRALC